MSSCKRVATIILLFLGLLLKDTFAQAAFVSTTGGIEIGNLQFSSTDPNAQLLWTDDWYGTVTVHAQDTTSGSDDDFQDFLGNDGSLNTQANSALVETTAEYSVSGGGNVGSGIGTVSAAVSSSSTLNSPFVQADSLAYGSLDNFFMITGVTDPVEVTFSIDYSGQIMADADAAGTFDIGLEAVFSMEDLFGNVLGSDVFYQNEMGSDTSFNQSYSGTLSITAILTPGIEYFASSYVGIEPREDTPIPTPGTLLLIILGLAMNRRARIRLIRGARIRSFQEYEFC